MNQSSKSTTKRSPLSMTVHVQHHIHAFRFIWIRYLETRPIDSSVMDEPERVIDQKLQSVGAEVRNIQSNEFLQWFHKGIGTIATKRGT